MITMKQLRDQTPFTRTALARYARLSEDTLRKMEEGIPVSRESAEKALSAYNRILSTHFTLDQISVSLTD